MRRIWSVNIFSLLLVGLLVSALGLSAQTTRHKDRDPKAAEARLTEQVRHQLAMLPWYGVFDNLEFKLDGDHVTLMGQVTRPVLKSDAEATVKHIEGVASVKNQIEILPPSPNDDRIRRATYRAIYGTQGLDRYTLQAVPPIHIIVKGGHVTLVGVVANEVEKNVAYIRANEVPGVFSVTNNLRVKA